MRRPHRVRRSQVTWLRDRLLKLGVHVVRSVRRVVLHLPCATPYLDAWRRIALAPRSSRRIGPTRTTQPPVATAHPTRWSCRCSSFQHPAIALRPTAFIPHSRPSEPATSGVSSSRPSQPLLATLEPRSCSN